MNNMCLYPRLIDNRKYIANKKNGGVVPPVLDKRVLSVPVGCGKCKECLKQKARNWQVRLHEEVKSRKNGKFITFSFSNKSLIELGKGIKLSGYDLDNEIATLAVRRFLERWRKKFKRSVRHWFVTELGQKNTERVHIHGLIFTDEENEVVDKIWSYGNTYFGEYVNERTVNYIVKYISKSDAVHKEYKPKILTSPGIGNSYVERKDSNNNKYKKGGTIETYRNRQGFKLALPSYYRNKIYSEEEREKLWLEKLDKGIRFVDGIKVDISKGEDDYFKLLEQIRLKNERLGFGDNKINWERRRYENERRNLKKKEIILRKFNNNA